MATAPTTQKDEDEKVTPADQARMQEQLDQQKREKAEEKAYNAADKMSGEKAPKKMAKGGTVKCKIDGIAQRGKTKLGRG